MQFIKSSQIGRIKPARPERRTFFHRTAASALDVATLFRHALFHDIKGTLFNYGVNVGMTLLALVLMRHMHTGAYQLFYNYVTGDLNPGILIILAAFTIVLVGAEFIFVGLTFYPKGYVPNLIVKLVTSIRDSIVVLSGASLSLAVLMFGQDPVGRWEACATAVIYFASAYLIAFLLLAPYWLESRRIGDRVALVVAGLGLLLLVWFWPDLFSPDFIKLDSIVG
jgi:cation transport ATPase